jgi:hypothetical protein
LALDKERTLEAQELVRRYYLALADDDTEKISKEEYDMTAEMLLKGTMNLRVICLLFTIEQHTKTNEYHRNPLLVLFLKRKLSGLVHSRMLLLEVW